MSFTTHNDSNELKPSSSPQCNDFNNHNADDVDSDYNSMFGGDSGDEDDMFGSSDNSHDDENKTNNNSLKEEEQYKSTIGNAKEENTIISHSKDEDIPPQQHVQANEKKSIPSSSSTMKIPRKMINSNNKNSSSSGNMNSRKRRRVSSPPLPSTGAAVDNTIAPSFDIETYNEYALSIVDSPSFAIDDDDDEEYDTMASIINTNATTNSIAKKFAASKKPTLKLLDPDQYPKFDMDDFMRIMRSWDFIHDLNQSMKKRPQVGNDVDSDDDDDDDNANHKIGDNTSQSKQQQQQSLPDEFHCHEQYTASFCPLLLNEIKAQIISDVTTLKTQQVIPLSKMVQAVKAVIKLPSGCKSREENYNDYLTLHITAPSNNHGRIGHNSSNSSSSAGGGYSSSSRSNKIPQQFMSRSEFVQNEMVLLITEPSFLDQAFKGNLKLNKSNGTKKSAYSMATLLSNASPFVVNRLGVVGVVMQRSKNLQSGVVIQISDGLLKNNVGKEFDICLLRLGHCVTCK